MSPRPKIKHGHLPPSSRVTGVRWTLAACMTMRATFWEPKRSEENVPQKTWDHRARPVKPRLERDNSLGRGRSYPCRRCGQSGSSEEPGSPLLPPGPPRNSPATTTGQKLITHVCLTVVWKRWGHTWDRYSGTSLAIRLSVAGATSDGLRMAQFPVQRWPTVSPRRREACHEDSGHPTAPCPSLEGFIGHGRSKHVTRGMSITSPALTKRSRLSQPVCVLYEEVNSRTALSHTLTLVCIDRFPWSRVVIDDGKQAVKQVGRKSHPTGVFFWLFSLILHSWSQTLPLTSHVVIGSAKLKRDCSVGVGI